MDPNYPALSPFSCAAKGVCPRCGIGPLFKSPFQLVESCQSCGLDIQDRDSGDGPAVFGVLFGGAIGVIVMAIMEFNFRPSIWFHLSVQVPLLSAIIYFSLHKVKALLIALHFEKREACTEPDDEII